MPPSINERDASIAIDTGWCLAKPCSQPGIVPTTTNADDANTSGARIGNDAACAVSALLDREADDREDPREREAEEQHHRHAGEQPEEVGVDAEADEIPDADHQDHDEDVAHEVGERAAGQHRRARHRQRAEPLDEALVQVLGEPDPGFDRTEHDGLHEDAGHQVVDVGRRSGS